MARQAVGGGGEGAPHREMNNLLTDETVVARPIGSNRSRPRCSMRSPMPLQPTDVRDYQAAGPNAIHNLRLVEQVLLSGRSLFELQLDQPEQFAPARRIRVGPGGNACRRRDRREAEAARGTAAHCPVHPRGGCHLPELQREFVAKLAMERPWPAVRGARPVGALHQGLPRRVHGPLISGASVCHHTHGAHLQRSFSAIVELEHCVMELKSEDTEA